MTAKRVPRHAAKPTKKPRATTGAAARVPIVGFSKLPRSKHSEADLRAIVGRSLAHTKRVWGWSPTNLNVQFHTSAKSFGFARAPGSGPKQGVTIISLSRRLMAEYGAAAVQKTMVHELCHHYREERFPVTPELRRVKGHDAVFCRELARVEPSVNGDYRSCRYFTAERVTPDIDRRVKWSHALGRLRFVRKRGRGQMVFWEANKVAAWTPPEILATDSEMVTLAKRFKRSDWNKVRLIGLNTGITTLGDLLAWVVKHKKHHFPGITAVFLGRATKPRK